MCEGGGREVWVNKSRCVREGGGRCRYTGAGVWGRGEGGGRQGLVFFFCAFANFLFYFFPYVMCARVCTPVVGPQFYSGLHFLKICSIFFIRFRPTPLAGVKRHAPVAELQRPAPVAELQRPAPVAELQRPSPVADARRPAPGAEVLRPAPAPVAGAKRSRKQNRPLRSRDQGEVHAGSEQQDEAHAGSEQQGEVHAGSEQQGEVHAESEGQSSKVRCIMGQPMGSWVSLWGHGSAYGDMGQSSMCSHDGPTWERGEAEQ